MNLLSAQAALSEFTAQPLTTPNKALTFIYSTYNINLKLYYLYLNIIKDYMFCICVSTTCLFTIYNNNNKGDI